VCHVVHSGASGVRNFDTLFFMLWWDRYRFHEKRIGTSYAELVFLHPVGFAGHVLFRCIRGMKCRRTIFHAWVGLVRIAQKVRRNTFHWTCDFASSGIYGSSSAFWCVWGAKRRRTIFHARVGPVWIWQKALQDMLRRTWIFYPVGSTGHVVHSSVSVARNAVALFFILGWTWSNFDEKRVRTHYDELVFLHSAGSAAHIVHSIASGARNVDALFFMLRWDRYGFDKKRTWTRDAELVFLHLVGPAGHVVHSGAFGAWCGHQHQQYTHTYK
jgi:hypothetical protein